MTLPTALGKEIAIKADYDGQLIAEAFIEALRESNEHKLNLEIIPIIEKYFNSYF